MAQGVVKTATATIRAGETLSNPVDITSTVVTMMISPDDWNAGPISFLTSADNVKFSNMVDRTGAEITLHVFRGSAMSVDPDLTRSTVFLKIRSGSMQNPLVQDADRSFQFVLSSS